MTDKDSIHFLTKEEITASSAAKSDSTSTNAPATEPGASDDNDALPQSAFNERTGEINWDCPCLGGMAKGPCGEEFKSAFSCFVFSEADPKGADCVSLFQQMQSCFRDYPEYYADQLEDDDEFNANSKNDQMMTETSVEPVATAAPVDANGDSEQPSAAGISS